MQEHRQRRIYRRHLQGNHRQEISIPILMGVVRTTYLIDEQGIIIKANDKVKAADDPENMLKELA